jgi:hypothetical protein
LQCFLCIRAYPNDHSVGGSDLGGFVPESLGMCRSA